MGDKEDNWGNRVSSLRESVNKVGRWESPSREDLSAEGEEYPLLEAVTGKRLVNTQQAGKALACALVICKFWR
jgi:hypothetical protein